MDGHKITDDTLLANILACKIIETNRTPERPFNSSEDAITHHITQLRHETIDDVEELSAEEITTTIARSNNTCPGSDGISNKILKATKMKIAAKFEPLFNQCLKRGYYPTQFKSAIITLIPKNDKPIDTKDYRPISLTNTIGKILVRILAGKIMTFAEEHNILPKYQYGFRREPSTQDAILRLLTNIIRGMNEREPTVAIFLDREKAYLRKIIQSFLIQRTNRVKINNKLLEEFSPEAGIPQRSPLAPILFNVYSAN